MLSIFLVYNLRHICWKGGKREIQNNMDTSVLRVGHSQRNQNSQHLCLYIDSIIWTFSSVPLVSVLKKFAVLYLMAKRDLVSYIQPES